ncbi:MAG TPA: DUF2520 domain-containing protein [Syntrophales bacterium]|nr:DUF2520 domain-containing protein [Syntrophales bacterium]
MIGMKEKERIAILGSGKVGTAVGHLLKRAGYDIVAIADLILDEARRAVAYTGGEPTTDLVRAAREANCILITTNDDAISDVCEAVATGGGIQKGDKVVHTSGVGGLELLRTARSRGAQVACIHPLQTFADVESAIVKIPGSTFGITADEAILPWADRIVEDLGGRPFHIPGVDKALYHAAACMASNYLVTLMYLVEETYGRMGMSREEAIRAFWPLVQGTIDNLESKGTLPSLTGPIARGDGGTVRKHLRSLRKRFPGLLKLYREMGLFTAEVAEKKGTLKDEQLAEIRSILKGGKRG